MWSCIFPVLIVNMGCENIFQFSKKSRKGLQHNEIVRGGKKSIRVLGVGKTWGISNLFRCFYRLLSIAYSQPPVGSDFKRGMDLFWVGI